MENLQEKGSSTSLAYELAIQSYDRMHRNRAAVHSLFLQLIGFSVPLTLAIPVLSRALELSIEPHWWVAIALPFVATTGCCLVARLRWPMMEIDPMILYEDYLGYSAQEFQQRMILAAGQDFENGRRAIEKKWRCCVAISIALCVEVLVVIAWAATATKATVVV